MWSVRRNASSPLFIIPLCLASPFYSLGLAAHMKYPGNSSPPNWLHFLSAYEVYSKSWSEVLMSRWIWIQMKQPTCSTPIGLVSIWLFFFFSHYKDSLSPTEHLINLGKDKWVMCWSLDWFKLLTALQHMGILTFANANLHIWNVFGVLLYFYYNRSLELMLLLIFKIYQLFV